MRTRPTLRLTCSDFQEHDPSKVAVWAERPTVLLALLMGIPPSCRQGPLSALPVMYRALRFLPCEMLVLSGDGPGSQHFTSKGERKPPGQTTKPHKF